MSARPSLSADEVREIFLSDEPVKIVAHRYHTAHGTISRIRNGEQHAATTQALILCATLITMAAWPADFTAL